MESAPLSDQEKRIIAAEAIKLSSIPLEKLLDLLREANVIPEWDHMVLPPGRTMAMCKNAFNVYFPTSYPQTFQSIPHIVPRPQVSSKRKSGSDLYEQRIAEPPIKRRQSAVETKSGGRELAPKPSNGSPGPTGSMTGKVAKKRGRPSKADVERNKAEAIAKGVIMAPIMTMNTGSPQGRMEDSGGYATLAPTPIATTGTFYDPTLKVSPEREVQEAHPGDSPGKKKRKQAPVKPKALAPGQISFPVSSPMAPSRDYEQPQPSNPMSYSSHGPVSGSIPDRQPPSLHSYPITNEQQTTTEPRSHIG